MGEKPGETPSEQDLAELGEDHPVVKALRAVRSERNELKGQVKTLSEGAEKATREADTFVDLKSKHPWLDRKHLKGRDVEEWESWTEELNLLRGPTPTTDPALETPAPADRPEVAELAKAAQISGTPGALPQKHSAKELLQMLRTGEITSTEMNALVAKQT